MLFFPYLSKYLRPKKKENTTENLKLRLVEMLAFALGGWIE